MTRTIHPRLTPGRRRHLEALADGQPRRIMKPGPVGFQCRKLGWCAFALRVIATGEVVPSPGGRWFDENGVKLYDFLTDPWDGAEIITPEGLRELEAARERERPTPPPSRRARA